MASREMKLAAVFSEGKSAWVQDGANWVELPGFLDWTESGGERDSRSTGTDSTRPHGVVSNPKASTVEMTFKYVAHPSWDVIDDAFNAKTNLNFRMDTDSEIIAAPAAQCAIAADGTCTFTGTDASDLNEDSFPLGSDVVIGGTHYPVLQSLASNGTFAVKVKATAAVSAADFNVVTPAERVSFRGKVSMTPTRQHTLAQQSEREGTLTVQSLSMLPKPVRIV